jgi:adenylate cyclase
MATDVRTQSARLSETTLVMMLADLAGFTRVVASFDAIEIAEIVDEFYTLAADRVNTHGGRVVKYAGDNCLATFDARAGQRAVQCAHAIRAAVQALGDRIDVALDTGINVHRATVVAGSFGPEGNAQYDLTGTGVIHLFRMGSGAGIRVSEPVYRQLPNDERTPWHKYQPPATYTFA